MARLRKPAPRRGCSRRLSGWTRGRHVGDCFKSCPAPTTEWPVYGEISRGPAALVVGQGRRAEGFTLIVASCSRRDRLERCTVAQKDGCGSSCWATVEQLALAHLRRQGEWQYEGPAGLDLRRSIRGAQAGHGAPQLDDAACNHGANHLVNGRLRPAADVDPRSAGSTPIGSASRTAGAARVKRCARWRCARRPHARPVHGRWCRSSKFG